MELTITNNLKKPLVQTIFKAERGQFAFTVVRVLVQRFIDSFAFTQKLNATQIDSLTVDTLEHFKCEALEDIMLFFKMARTGKFGTTKRGVDGNLLFGEWFPMYLELKAIEREAMVERKKQEYNADDLAKKRVAYTYQQILQKQQHQNAKAYINRLTENFDRQMLEDTIISWQRDADMKHYLPLLKLKRRSILK